MFPAIMSEGAHILREAGTAERIAGLQIIRREIEPGIETQYLHHRLRVDLHLLAQAPDLVSESGFGSVEGVAGVLHHFRGVPIDYDGFLAEERNQFRRKSLSVSCADDGQRWLAKIGHRS